MRLGDGDLTIAWARAQSAPAWELRATMSYARVREQLQRQA